MDNLVQSTRGDKNLVKIPYKYDAASETFQFCHNTDINLECNNIAVTSG